MLSAQRNSQTFIGWLCIMPYFIGVVFLSYYGGTRLESAMIFIIMGLFSLVAAWFAYSNDIRPFKWWDGKFDKQDLRFIAIGYVSLLVIVLGITYVMGGGAIAILIALSGGGVMLYFTLDKGQSVLVPLIVHSAYNTTALALAGASILPISSFAFYVPNFSFEAGRPVDFTTQLILPFGFVAFGEELLKISIALGIFALTRSKNMGIGISIALWVILHSILTYRIRLPF